MVLANCRPGERAVATSSLPASGPPAPRSALRALAAVCGIGSPVGLGEDTPPVAARCTAGSEGCRQLRLFEVVFGRDALRVADLLWTTHPVLTGAAVRRLAQHQGTAVHAPSEEEPGAIPHELRPPTTGNATGPGRPGVYYGTADAGPMFVSAAVRLAWRDPTVLAVGVTHRRGGRRTVGRALADALARLCTALDRSPLGLLESHPTTEASLVNQVWKDSWDAYLHRDGTPARAGTVASVEAQALAHDALLDAADLLDGPDPGTAWPPPWEGTGGELRDRAARLRERVLNEFWVEDDAYFALAVDRDDRDRPRQLPARASNMGHLLDSRMLDGEDPDLGPVRAGLVEALSRPDMVCGAGIRTLSSDEPRYWPTSYHNGSSWPWDTYVVARGLQRHGFHDPARDLKRRVWRTYARFGFPEFVPGTDRLPDRLPYQVVDVVDGEGRPNRLQQPPQEVQAWTVAAVLAIKREWGGAVAPAPGGKVRGP